MDEFYKARLELQRSFLWPSGMHEPLTKMTALYNRIKEKNKLLEAEREDALNAWGDLMFERSKLWKSH